ncbi:MAG: septation protein IspZ [Proteobacteria bacterium]|nr:septation protein IspZ [Pseudomonadota bacterium]
MKDFLLAARPLIADFVSVLIFMGVTLATHNPFLATGIAMAAGLAQVLWLLATRRPVGVMQWVGLGLVAVSGTATLLSHDPRFMMFKPTLIYAIVGAAMLKPGWMLHYMPPIVRERVGERSIVGWGYAWSALMFATGVLNAAAAMDGDVTRWGLIMTIAPLASKAVLFLLQYASIHRAIRRSLMASAEVKQRQQHRNGHGADHDCQGDDAGHEGRVAPHLA